MEERYHKIEEYLLLFMIVGMPIMALPVKIPFFDSSVPSICLSLALLVWVIHCFQTRTVPIAHGKFLLMCCIWLILCTVIGAYTYSFWDESIMYYLQGTRVVKLIAHIWPGIITSTLGLETKFLISQLISLVRSLFFPLLGIFLLYYSLYRKKPQRGLEWMSKIAIIMVCTLGLYSIPEIVWLWTGSPLAESILISINQCLYIPASSHSWWPPLLWPGQLRSYALEPSYFGITAAFLMPFLWYRVQQKKSKFVIFLIFYLSFMIFMTKARTATVIYLFELATLILSSIFSKYADWKKVCTIAVISAVFSFGFYMASNTVVTIAHTQSSGIQTQDFFSTLSNNSETYIKKNITSVSDKGARSNTARFGNTVAMTKVGVQHPIFGVGFGYYSMYMVDNFPEFAKDNREIKLWTSFLLKEGFWKTGYPALNTFSYIFAQFGLIGVLLFCAPLIYLMWAVFKRRTQLCNRPDIIFLVIALIGQIGCLFSQIFFYSYPITLSLLYCTIFGCVKSFV